MSDDYVVGPSREQETRLIAALRDGASRTAACKEAIVERRTFKRWMELGRLGKSGLSEFYHRVREAEADALTMSRVVGAEHIKADPATWRWFMARRYPDQWGKQREEPRQAPASKDDGRLFERVRGAIIAALEPYPEAKYVVSAAIRAVLLAEEAEHASNLPRLGPKTDEG